MCLVVEKGIRKKIAKTDILVYKCLDKKNGNYYTPFQNVNIFFDNGECVMEKIPNIVPKRVDGHREIGKGLHSFYKKRPANTLITYFPQTKIYYAIIPKGSEYYIGTNGEIVSNNLMVFETKEDYQKYKKKAEKICIIDVISLSLQEI